MHQQAAARLYQDALALDPDQPEALHGLGCLAYEAGEHARAIAFLARAVKLRPRAAHSYVALGLALFADRQPEAARAALSLACLHDPRDGRAQAAHGRVLASLGRTADAVGAFDRALALDRENAELHHERAAVLLAQGRDDAACDGFRAAHILRPGDPATGANLGAALQMLNRSEEAEPILSASLAASPDRPETLSTRGLARAALGQLDAAIEDCSRAHALAPDNPVIGRHLAFCLYERDDRAGARALLQAILARDPEDHAARYNLGLLDLAEAHYQAGWRAHESRHALVSHPWPRDEWDGEPRATALLLGAEQGLGDTLQFLRYARLAAGRAGAATLSLPASLRRAACSLDLPLIESRPGASTCPVGSLPRLFSPSVEAIPPPFAAWHDPHTASRWQRRLHAGQPGALRVGLAWAGSPGYRQDRRRSIAPALLEPLLDVPRIQFVSLQRGASIPGILDPGAELHDVAETAALIMALDLVVTVDTAIVHLAAGLGKPTWLLDRTGGDWRWLRDREDSPWYPSVRIFRQTTADPPALAWPPVIERVRDALVRY